MSGNGWSSDVWVNGRPPDTKNSYFLSVSPKWLETMSIPLIDGRDFGPSDNYPDVAIVNEAFARRYFNGQSPVGKSFERVEKDKRVRTEIIGYVKDARYRTMREPIRDTVYVPFSSRDEEKGGLRPKDWATLIVRTAGANPLRPCSDVAPGSQTSSCWVSRRSTSTHN